MVMALRMPEGAVNEVEPVVVDDVSKFIHGHDRLHKGEWSCPLNQGGL